LVSIMNYKLATMAFLSHQLELVRASIEQIGYHAYILMIYGNNLLLCLPIRLSDRRNLMKSRFEDWLN
jgi:hypothetical protein